MNLNYLKYFCTLTEIEHVTKAADILCITQPSLSNAIRQMEEELRVSLFEKKGRNIYLTKYGKIYYDYVKKGLQQFEAGETALFELNNPSSGHVDIGFFNSLGVRFVPTLVEKFLTEPQYKNYTFNFEEGSEDKITTGLKAGKYDIIFCSTVWPDPDVNYTKIASEPMYIFVSNKHPLAQYKQLSLKELADEPFISFSQPCGLQVVINRMLKKYNVHVQGSYSAGQGATIAGLVAANFGVAILPDIQLPELPITKIAIKEHIEPRYIYMATYAPREIPVSCKNFIAYVRDSCCL